LYSGETSVERSGWQEECREKEMKRSAERDLKKSA
jgi:hypothetical protein